MFTSAQKIEQMFCRMQQHAADAEAQAYADAAAAADAAGGRAEDYKQPQIYKAHVGAAAAAGVPVACGVVSA